MVGLVVSLNTVLTDSLWVERYRKGTVLGRLLSKLEAEHLLLPTRPGLSVHLNIYDSGSIA